MHQDMNRRFKLNSKSFMKLDLFLLEQTRPTTVVFTYFPLLFANVITNTFRYSKWQAFIKMLCITDGYRWNAIILRSSVQQLSHIASRIFVNTS